MEQHNVETLIPFLRNLADSIEKEQLMPAQLQKIGEFFMSYQFKEQVRNDDNNSTQPESLPPAFSKKDLIKFLSLGWYVYQILLKEDTLD